MGDRGHIFNIGDLQATAVQCPNSGFTARARAHDANLDILHAVFLGRIAGALGCHLRCKRRGFTRAAEAAATRRRPGERVSLTVGDGDNGVVEGRMDVRNRIQYVLADLLASGLTTLPSSALPRTLLLISHVFNSQALRAELNGAGDV